MKVRMYLQVRQASAPLGVLGGIWYKDIETDCVPLLNVDQVILVPYEDEGPDDGPIWHVKSRCMSGDGSWNISLENMVVFTGEETVVSLGEGNAWHIATDGDPDTALRRGGWQRYGEE